MYYRYVVFHLKFLQWLLYQWLYKNFIAGSDTGTDISPSLIAIFSGSFGTLASLECLPKAEIKLLKISRVRILILVYLLFVAVINPY